MFFLTVGQHSPSKFKASHEGLALHELDELPQQYKSTPAALGQQSPAKLEHCELAAQDASWAFVVVVIIKASSANRVVFVQKGMATRNNKESL